MVARDKRIELETTKTFEGLIPGLAQSYFCYILLFRASDKNSPNSRRKYLSKDVNNRKPLM